MKCKTCPDCGCNLDFGERCDCQEKIKAEPKVETPTKGGGVYGRDRAMLYHRHLAGMG